MHPDRITLFNVRMPLIHAFETSFGIEQERECILVRVESEGRYLHRINVYMRVLHNSRDNS